MPVRLNADISNPNDDGSSPNALNKDGAIGGTLNILTGMAKLARKMISRITQAYLEVLVSSLFDTAAIDIAILSENNS
jgi:hypothetical protein